jgi:NAD+ synthase (glutamine-hydrolysing)
MQEQNAGIVANVSEAGVRSTLRVAGAQVHQVVGDLSGNAEQIADAMAWAEEREADVLVLPELCLTGYPLQDLAGRGDFVDAAVARLDELAARSGRTATLVGTIVRVEPQRSWDTRERSVSIAQAVLCDGEIRGVYHKVLLPTYDVFDEARNFAAGRRPDALWRIGDVVAGISICEDMWSDDGPPEAQAAAGAEIIFAPNASPFYRTKPDARHELAATVARRNGVPVVYVNCVGGQDDLVFDGGSVVVGADGELLHRARQFEPDRFCLDIPVVERGARRAVATVHARPSRRREPLGSDSGPRPREQLPEVEQVRRALVLGVRDFAANNGFERAILGLSGGIDSSVCAAIAAEALGPGQVLGVSLPVPDSPAEAMADAERIAGLLTIEHRRLDLAGVMSALGEQLAPERDPEASARIEFLARTRAVVIGEIADEDGRLWLAPGNKSEISIGGAATFGDLAGHYAPLKDCPKTLVYELAAWLNRDREVVPEQIIERTPSLRARVGIELPSYEVLDPIVERYLEQGAGVDDLAADGFDPETVRGVLQLVDDASFERRLLPPGVKVTPVTFGMDRRMPITNAWRPYRREGAELAPCPPSLEAAIAAPWDRVEAGGT